MIKLFPAIFFLLLSCGDKNTQNTHFQSTGAVRHPIKSSYSDDEEESDDEDGEEGVEDGTHNATVQYYNPQTGHSATYYLDVEVENGEVNQINFPKGGWLDGSHISPEALESGKATIIDDEGREFDIEIDDN